MSRRKREEQEARQAAALAAALQEEEARRDRSFRTKLNVAGWLVGLLVAGALWAVLMQPETQSEREANAAGIHGWLVAALPVLASFVAVGIAVTMVRKVIQILRYTARN